MSKHPWNSIAESVVDNGMATDLSHSDALGSPCETCATSPCCTHLPLNNFRVTNLLELDHARYLLNFDNIELGLSASGDWSAYYTYPCRFLDRSTFGCTIHNQPHQPRICVNYNPYNCWYKRVFSVSEHSDFIRIDHARMQLLEQHIEFDAERKITSVPEWDVLLEMMAEFEDKGKAISAEPTHSDSALDQWETLILNPDDGAAEQVIEVHEYSQLSDPCAGCSAHCCTKLVFPHSPPTHVSNLDYYRFCLGFPGIELGVADGQWSIIVNTRCRHLTDDNRCAVYGKPERPQICKYYDEWTCTYKSQFDLARPEGFVRIRLEEIDLLANSLGYDKSGAIMILPPADALRQMVESQWHERGKSERIPLKVIG